LYGRWRYIEELGDPVLAAQVFAQIRNTTPIYPPEDDPQGADWAPAYYLPYIKNAFIAGYIGYIEIGRMAGASETELAPYVAELDRLLAERAEEFSFIDPEPTRWTNVLIGARNFMYMTPELADYLRTYASYKVETVLNAYSRIAPYWFVSKYDATSDEGALQPPYDYPALFQAKALIMRDPFDELVKYLDVPAFERGDLFYIQNLILALEAPALFPDIYKTGSSSTAHVSDVITFTLSIRDSDAPPTQTVPVVISDTLPDGLVYHPELCVSSWGDSPTCDAQSVSWQGVLSGTTPVEIMYTAQVDTPQPTMLTNQMEVDGGPWGYYTRSATITANPVKCYLPVVVRW